MQEDRRFLRRKEAAEYVRTRWEVRCAAQTLAKLAVLGGGPPCGSKRMSRSPRFRLRGPDPKDTRPNIDFALVIREAHRVLPAVSPACCPVVAS
jgi:hypothetical protein